ncbi:EscU/YscU/HrcU family type III secretion system export apparatus switch protein [Acerihabitans arboris]|uniref:EscU/YscU/HrcU family type III secretion system export apparatus switch protein n=1 Tax=Acerihabitans arboris TaxID=2691583 RepID=A0A845SEK4_9GAMM|nr:EscU/YscU/HrcU family type III secretion system export apparatus switch protein [Acerihabitans arboris]NDL61516.1 EscU/YscU/HrcU family type III secretion system export apparatus switch protein [Acerihabitans arboris]
MMANKTEKPTPKKLKDSAKKGQTFKCRELIIACLLLCGIAWLTKVSSLAQLLEAYRNIIAGNFAMEIKAYSTAIMLLGLKMILPILLACVLASALPTLLQTGFMLATKALKINFGALNPTKGFKKIFSIRTIKDGIKAMLHLGCFAAAAMIFWHNNKRLIFAQLHGSVANLVNIWRELLLSLVITCLLCIILVSILDALADYFLHIKELKMEKHEVKREFKEQEGNPEIKFRRRQLHRETLSEQTKANIKDSQFILVNPTHIAIGIYFDPDVVPAPFVSLRECNQRALAVRAYAEKIGVPVVRDIRLARKIYKTNKIYTFIGSEALDEIVQVLLWLKEVEDAWRREAIGPITEDNENVPRE